MATLELEKAKELVKRNDRIASTEALRRSWFRNAWVESPCCDFESSPAEMARANRANNLAYFKDFFEAEAGPAQYGLANRMDTIDTFLKNMGVARFPVRFQSLLVDKYFSCPDVTIEGFFENAFAMEETGKLSRWMKQVDKRVKESSETNLKAIDNSAEVVKKDIVLVGGGPLTSVVASVLGPYYNVTVITEQNSIGKPWRNRPLYINSSSEVKDVNGRRLPLLEGTTTPVGANQLLNTLDTDILLLADTKNVSCDDGSVRKYISGPRFGDLIATNIAFNVNDFIVNQTVDPRLVTVNPDKSVTLKLEDVDTGRFRTIDARSVFFLTGPGKEEPIFADSLSNVEYEETKEALETNISRAQKKINRLKKTIEEVEKSSNPDADKKLKRLKRELSKVNVPLPKILTLSSVESLYEFWFESLDADPARFPFKDLFENELDIAYIGSGDTTKTLKELIDGRGPKRAYPENYQRTVIAQSTIYNEKSSSTREFNARNRRRYRGVFDENTYLVQNKVFSCKIESDTFGEQDKVIIVDLDESGESYLDEFDYAFVATGFRRPRIENQFFDPNIQISPIRDSFGNVVALGDRKNNIYIAGSATGFKAKDFPPSLQNIIQGLGIKENTVALWVHGLLAERLAWSVSQRLPFNQDKLALLRKNIVTGY